MPITMTPEEYQAKHAERLKGSLEHVRRGVENVTEAPGAKAAAKADKWHASISSDRTKQKWRKNVAAVTLEAWKVDMLTKGVDRIPAGVDAAKDKVIAFAGKLFEHQNTGLRQLEGMNDVTLEDSIARVTFWIRHMSQMA